MTASEKLKALGEGNTDAALTLGAALMVMDALPQIVAVVEAAEIAKAATWQPHGKSYWEIEQLLNEIRDSADTALAALERVLDGE